jgi:hypothetical protein
MHAGCHPDGTGETWCTEACLPDPEDGETMLCWLGGVTPFGEACASSYECGHAKACNAAGVCSYACEDEGAPCPTLSGYTCRDFVCTPDGA